MSMSPDPRKKAVSRHLRLLAKDEAGSMTVYAIVFFVMLTAVGGLAIDLGRYYGVHGQMQAFVDHVALAAAAELDGNTTTHALCRSVRAATGRGLSTTFTGFPGCPDDPNGALVSGSQSFAQGAANLDVQQLTFFDVLGTDPTPPAPTPETPICTWIATNPTSITCLNNAVDVAERTVRIVEVLATPRTVSYFVLPIVNAIVGLGGGPSASPALQLHATASFKEEVCGATPILVCNPQEVPGQYNFPVFPLNTNVRQLRLTVATTAPWQPGDFALIGTGNAPAAVPSDAGGACNGDPLCMLGRVNPLTQCIADRVDAQTMLSPSDIAAALNTRFDIYDGPMAASYRTDPNFAPSANVTKGICQLSGGNCDYSGSTCSLANPGWGSPSTQWKGQWIVTTSYVTGDIVINNGQAYSAIANNTGQTPPNAMWMPTSSPPWGAITMRLPRDRAFQTNTMPLTRVGTDTSAQLTTDLGLYWNANTGNPLPSGNQNVDGNLVPLNNRYRVYRYEATHTIPNKYSTVQGENGNKTCSTQAGINTGMSATTRERRVLTVPIVNCLQNNVPLGTTTNIPVVAFAHLFLSEPVGLSPAGAVDTTKTDVYAEYIDIVKPTNHGSMLRDLAQLNR